jgi:hypothetical protein
MTSAAAQGIAAAATLLFESAMMVTGRMATV